MPNDETQRASVRVWLWTCTALVAAIVVVGGATRLTGSGLSITEWQPIRGAVPPMGAAAWDEFFALYQASPQYQLENTHFGLAEFKAIFWWEWGHRLLGRVIGLAVFLPLIVFWARRALPGWLKRRGTAVVLLVGFQGALGWFMVASGLVDEPRVSHLRLAAHLLTALLTYSVLIWTALDATAGHSRPTRSPLGRLLLGFFGLLTMQIGWGAFVAGLRAGLHYPTWPKMGAHWLPPEALEGMSPFRALVDGPVAVQFVHRWLGALVLIVGLTVLSRALRRAELRTSAVVTGLVLAGQFALGVLTVLNFYLQPVMYGVAHQAGALILVATTIVLIHQAGREQRPE